MNPEQNNEYDDLVFLEPIVHTSDEIERNMQRAKEKRRRRSIIKELLVYIGIIVFCLYIVPQFIILRTVVDGASMENSLFDNENVLVEKVSYYFKDPNRFDIIVFDHHNMSYQGTVGRAEDEDEFYVKRIIGLPNETVQIKDGLIYINGELLEEHYGKNSILNAGIAAEPITLGEDEYFVLGDNRLKSKDSRYLSVGLVSRDLIEGRVWIRIWPLDKFGKVD